jgi:hypothetical protein
MMLVAGALCACATSSAEDSLRLSRESFAQRQLETRRFETTDELTVLQSCLTVLQDKGFQMDEADAGLGVVTGSRSGAPSGMGGGFRVYYASLVTRPVGDGSAGVAVRVTLYGAGQTGLARVADPRVYQHFFDWIAKTVHLEAQSL